MAVYKRDMVDINLETGNIHRSFLKHSIGFKDQQADHFGLRAYRNGEPVNLTGVSIQGIFMPPQGDPIAITSGNIVNYNEAEVVLPQACYNYNGQFTLAIKLVDPSNSVTGTMRIVDGMVDNTHASGTVAPVAAIPSYQEVLSTYEQAIAAINKTVRFDAVQSLTDTQKATARGNISAASVADLQAETTAREAADTAINNAIGTVPSGKTVQGQIDTLESGKVPKTTTVNGHALSANVTVTKADVGLGNVDNTSDVNKPVSTAQQAAIDAEAATRAAADADLKSALDDISENTVNLWPYGNLTGTKSVYGNVSLTTGKKYIISAKITSSYTGSLNNSRVSFFNDSSSEQDHGQIAHDGERHSCVLTATANTTRLFFFAANTSINSTGYTVTVTDIQVEEQVEEDQDMTPYVPPVTATDFIARYSVGYYGVQTLTDTEKELARNNMGAASKDYADTLNSEIEDITEELEGDYSATIKEFTGCKPLMFSKGVYSTPSAGSESVKSAGGGNYVCMKEPVTEGDTITLNVKNDTSGYRAYALLDSTGKVVTLSDTPVSAKQIVTIPSGISYIVINNKLSLLSSGYYAYKGESLIERVSDISERTVNLWPHGDETFVKSLQNVPLSLPAGTYTLSAKITDSDPTIGTAKFYMHYVGGGSESKGITISEGRSKTSITLSEAIYKIRFDAAPTLEEADGVTSTWEDIQIEAGSKATDYVEYGYTAVDQCARNELVNTKGNIFGYKIAFFGDSITKGRDGNSSSTSPYPIPETVSKLLNIEAGNYGVGSIGWLEPVSEKTAYDIIAETDLTEYEYIVLCYGVNDTSSSYPVGSWDSTDETTIMGQVNKCVNYIYTQNNKAVVIIISPWNGFSYGSPPDYKYGSKMGSIANAEKQYCEYYNIPFIDQRSGPLNQWNMITTVSDGVITKAGLIGKDGVHPSNEGYKVLGSWIAGELSRLIR